MSSNSKRDQPMRTVPISDATWDILHQTKKDTGIPLKVLIEGSIVKGLIKTVTANKDKYKRG